jgi:hypothetical protein
LDWQVERHPLQQRLGRLLSAEHHQVYSRVSPVRNGGVNVAGILNLLD